MAILQMLLPLAVSAQGNMWQRALTDVEYRAEVQGTAADGAAPLWLTANRYGLSSTESRSGCLRASLVRDAARDSLSRWRLGYGVDLAAGLHFTSKAVVQQLYADVDYRRVRLSLGAKERPLQLKNQELSSGGQTFGINARPVPQVRIEIPEYLNIGGRGHWAAIKGHFGYGIMTDGRFQRDYTTADNDHYARHTLYHTKAGYLRLGNEDKFPLTFEGGLEMACQFGGTVYYTYDTSSGAVPPPVHMGQGIGDFVDAVFGTGGDPGEGVYANATGNTVGSWLFRLNYKGRGWRVSAYLDHFFEDHSQMF